MTDSEEFQDLSPEFCGHEARQGPPLSLRQIEVFRAIMMAGSISGAGRMLHVSQPAVSRVLALTETRLGYPLFERAKGRLLPTPEARNATLARLHADGVLVLGCGERSIRLRPALTVTEEELHLAVEAIAKAVQ